MTTSPVARINLWNEITGYPTPGINTTRFSVAFNKLPNVRLFANKINLPQITLGSASQPTPYLDMKQVGLYQWMYDLSVQGLNSDTISTCTLIHDAGEIEFLEVFPVTLGSLVFDATQTDINYPVINVVFECDRYIVK